MKTQARSLIERLGFKDPDRDDPTHDEIQQWVHNNIELVLKSLSEGEKTFDVWYNILEHPIVQYVQNYQNVVGFVDLYAAGYVIDMRNETKKHFEVYIEIKSKIASCGDLIRQINFYRNFKPGRAVWVIVCPDDRFEDVLRRQHIYFYRYG